MTDVEIMERSSKQWRDDGELKNTQNTSKNTKSQSTHVFGLSSGSFENFEIFEFFRNFSKILDFLLKLFFRFRLCRGNQCITSTLKGPDTSYLTRKQVGMEYFHVYGMVEKVELLHKSSTFGTPHEIGL